MSYIVKNFEKHQHYKDRRPPWIKLHRTLLDDCEFLRLHVASRALAPLLWLLASEENDGIIKGDAKDIAFRLRLDAAEVTEGIRGLLSISYISCYRDASNMLAPCKQEARVETERETETETETESMELFPVQGIPEEPKEPASKPWEPTACMLEIGSWFNRRPTTRWQKNELKAFKEICGGDDFPPEIHIVRAFYTAKIIPDKDTRDTRRQDLVTLLNNWNGEIDKAKRFIVARRRVEPTFAMEVKL
jgi:hypothetical protein